MGVSGFKIGDTIHKYKYASLEGAPDSAGGSGTFLVTVTYADDAYTADKSYAEINAALQDGRNVDVVLGLLHYRLFFWEDDPGDPFMLFSSINLDSMSTIMISPTAVDMTMKPLQTSDMGDANAGKFLVVGSTGYITTKKQNEEVTVSTAGTVTQALDAGKLYHFTGDLTSLTITLKAAPSGQLAQYHFDFDCGSTAPTVTLPNTVILPDNNNFDANMHYEVDILNNYGAVMAWATS